MSAPHIEASQHPAEGFQKMACEAFHDREVRFGFIRKVYGILSVQLLFTTAFCLAAMSIENSIVVLFNPAILGAVLATYLSSICALLCCGLDRKVPVNFILLGVFTLCVSWLVAAACVTSEPVAVLEAAALTAAVVIGITIFAFTTKNDFTVCGPVLFVLGMILLTASLLAVIFGPSENLLFCCLGVFLFSFYLIIDTQLIIGGSKHRYEIGVDSYILASVLLYLDIINLFLKILEILGRSK